MNIKSSKQKFDMHFFVLLWNLVCFLIPWARLTLDIKFSVKKSEPYLDFIIGDGKADPCIQVVPDTLNISQDQFLNLN